MAKTQHGLVQIVCGLVLHMIVCVCVCKYMYKERAEEKVLKSWFREIYRANFGIRR